MHYYYAVTVSPSFADDPPRVSGNNFLWAQKSNLEEKTMVRGANWSERGVKITTAFATMCQKCNKLRPEVSYKKKTFFFFLRVMTKLK